MYWLTASCPIVINIRQFEARNRENLKIVRDLKIHAVRQAHLTKVELSYFLQMQNLKVLYTISFHSLVLSYVLHLAHLWYVCQERKRMLTLRMQKEIGRSSEICSLCCLSYLNLFWNSGQVASVNYF